MDHKKGAEVDSERATEVQEILEKLVTHLLLKKPDDPVTIFSVNPLDPSYHSIPRGNER